MADRRYIAFTKGGVDGLLDVASHVWVEGKAQVLDSDWRSRIEAANDRLAKKGMRVLGVAFRLMDSIPEIIQTDLEQNLTLVGLFGMIDPPRTEVKDAVASVPRRRNPPCDDHRRPPVDRDRDCAPVGHH